MSTSGVITTGITEGPVVTRLELRTFLEDKDVTNLYVLAVDRMQKKDQQDPTSWYQLASIHGRPYRPWDNVGDKSGHSAGYCTHSSVLFPSWHRPYLALFEQIVSKNVFEVAKEYTNASDKQRYLDAAKRFRLPYWDWALHPELPFIVGVDETVTVHTPSGTKTIPNPLYAYKFHPVYDYFGDGAEEEGKWETWQSTVRYPTSKKRDGKSQPLSMQKELEAKHQITRDKTYILLTQTSEYGAFSNDSFTVAQDPISYNNIESIHNDIHGFAGEDGHMGAVDYAAYDPIFWLHHVNVDRIFAIWQALNPKAYVVPQENATGTWTTPPATKETSQTPLTPFRRTNDTFWDSDGVRDTHTFRYTYPELKRWSKLDANARVANLRADINRLYGSPVVQRLLDSYYEHDQKVASMPQPSELARNSAPANAGVKANFEIITDKLTRAHWHNTASKADDKLHYHEWLVNIVVKKYEVNASFAVRVFLGQPNKDPAQWSLDPNLVGSQVVFANNAAVTGCQRCREAAGMGQRVTGTIPLTGFLGDRMHDKNLPLEPEQIIPYLQENFVWKVQKLDGKELAVPSLRVSIGHALVEIPEPGSAHNAFPTWGPVTMHLNCH